MARAEKKKPGTSKRSRASSKQAAWYLADDDATMAKDVCGHVARLRNTELVGWRSEVLRRMRIYAGGFSVNGIDYAKVAPRARYNIVRSTVDTGAAIMCAARTLPYFQTRGADFKKRRQAQLKTRCVQTQFSQVGIFKEVLSVITDALVTGLGALRFFEDRSKPGGAASCERALPLSIIWDPRETVSGLPRTLYSVNLIDRDELDALYPGHEAAITAAPGASDRDSEDFQLTRHSSGNQCVVVEAWKLPSSAESDDGVHIIAVPGAMLLREQWTSPRFPFAFLRGWLPNQLGFVGTSLVELCEAAQLELEEIDDFVSECQRRGSKPIAFLPKGAKLEPEQLDNEAMSVYRYDPVAGAKPEFFVFSATPQDLPQQHASIREQTLSMIGMSQQQIQGAKPAGVSSAVGLRTVEDISSKRHVQILRYLEAFYEDCAHALVDLNDRIAAEAPDFAIRARILA